MTENHPIGWLERAARSNPDAAALISGSTVLSFSRLKALTDGWAASLLANGMRRGRPLGAILGAADLLVPLALAAWRAGMPIFPVNPKFPPEAIRTRFAKAGVDQAICNQPVDGVRCLSAARLGETAAPPQPGLAPGDVHLLVATSGSTGEPKAVMLTGANLAGAVQASRARLDLGPGDCWASALPLAAIGGMSVPLRCIEAGATALIHDGFDTTRLGADLAAGRVTHISVVPAMLAALLDDGIIPSPALRCVLVGGAALSPALAERAWAAGWPVRPSYGMSETASQVATYDGPADRWIPGLAGQPLPDYRIALSDSDRIRIKGPSVMAGYANPDLRPGDGLDQDGWYETNDLGRIEDDGSLTVLGRADDVLVSGGYKLHPLEIEHLAQRCPGIDTVAVTGHADAVWGDVLVAIFTGNANPEDILAWCRTNMASHLRPRRAVKVQALPLLTSGKLNRAALRGLAEQSLR